MGYMNNMNIYLHQDIFTYLNLESKIKYKIINKYFNDNLLIKKIDSKYRCLLTDEILKNYENLIELDASDSTRITNVSYMKNLKILHAYGISRIDDEGLPESLVKLNALNNPKITIKID